MTEGSFTTVSSLYFPTAKRKQPQLHPAQKEKNDLMGDGIHFATQKRVSIRKLRRASQPFLFALPFSAQSSSAAWEGGPRATFYEGAGFGPLIHRLTSRCRWGRITISPDKRCLSETNFPLDGIRISVIFSFSLPARDHRIPQAQRSAV